MLDFILRFFRKAYQSIYVVMLRLRFSDRLHLGTGISFRNGFIVNCGSNGKVSIGNDCFFNNGCSINSHNNVIIGNDCLFGEGVKIYDHDHCFADINSPIRDQGFTEGQVKIGDGCWIGSNVVILRDADVGEGSIIGAGSIVKGAVPPFTVLVCKHALSMRPRT